MTVAEETAILAYKIRHEPLMKLKSEAIAKAMELASNTSGEAIEVTEQLINGSFDSGALNTNIETKLNQLEIDYAPKLTGLDEEINEARGGYNALADFNDWLTQAVKDISINSNTFSTLQEGLDYTAANKKRLIVNSGVYELDSLVIPANSNVSGVGEVTFNPIDTVNFYVRIAGDNVILNDLIIDGLNKIDKGITLDIGVKHVSINNVKVRNIYATDKQARGIFIQEGCKHIFIDGCDIDTVYSVPNEIITDDAGSAKGISISSMTDSGAEIPQHITIRNTRIANVGPIEDGDGVHAYFTNGQMNLLIENCTFENCSKRFLKFQTNGVLVKNSNFKFDKVVTGADDCLKQVIAYYGNDIRFESNFIELDDALSVADFTNSISEINRGNTFKDNFIKIKKLHGTYGMFYSIAQIEDVEIAGNMGYVQEKTYTGEVSFIYLRKLARRFNIHDNIFRGALTHGITVHTQDIVDVSNGKIGNNIINGVSDYLVNVMNDPKIKVEVFGTDGSNTKTDHTGMSLVRTSNPYCYFHDNVGGDIYTTLPPATKTWRGKWVTLVAASASDMDKLYICVHKSGTSLTSSTIEFIWKELAYV